MADLLQTAVYYRGENLDDLHVTWRHQNGSLVAFASEPHTFVLKLENRKDPGTVVLTKSGGAGFTGFDVDPNLVVAWIGAELDLPPGAYDGEILATRASDGKKRDLPFAIEVRRRVGSAV